MCIVGILHVLPYTLWASQKRQEHKENLLLVLTLFIVEIGQFIFILGFAYQTIITVSQLCARYFYIGKMWLQKTIPFLIFIKLLFEGFSRASTIACHVMLWGYVDVILLVSYQIICRLTILSGLPGWTEFDPAPFSSELMGRQSAIYTNQV